MTNYPQNYMKATARAAKLTGIDVTDIRNNYRKVNDAPKGVKRACILAHRIMKGYDKAPVAEPVEA